MRRARTFSGMILLALPALFGCTNVWRGEPDFQAGILMPGSAATPQPIENSVPTTCGNLLNAAPGGPTSIGDRNSCIYAMMSIIDHAYYEYRKDLHRTVDVGHATADIIGIGLGSAGALVPGATTKSILAAISAGVAGARGKIDADILYSNSITLIITQMDADRADWKSRIIAQMSDNTKSTYTMYQAATDLLAYYEAGTWDHALVSLDTHAGANLSNCQAAVKSAQIAGSVNPDIACGPAPVVTPVAQDVQAHRAALAAFIKGLSVSDRRKLANAMSIPAQPTDPGVLRGLLLSISAATTADQTNAIAAEIKTLFGKDI